MHLLVLFLVFILASVFLPRAWRAFEMVIIAPFIGLALGMFVWSGVALFRQDFITLHWCEVFVLWGIVALQVVFVILRGRRDR